MITHNHREIFRLLAVGPLILALGCAANLGCREAAKGPPRVILQSSAKSKITVKVEVVSRNEDRAKGLMFRQKMASDAGMLFVYQHDDDHSFWMKNTFIPLDLIFITSNMRVVGIAENTKPLSTTHISIKTSSRYILEVNAGFAKKHKIREGSQVIFEGFDPTR
ncbi:MAG: DUF192 domain-containing protein [Deltaproteobacteria bacterium]|nr:DUF192 domain-containing protein [Deltaproteobacteria bacterium]